MATRFKNGLIADLEGNVTGSAIKAIELTATTLGDGTGLIPKDITFATITSSSAAKLLTLPAPIVGTKITLSVGANGCKLQSSAPATIGISGGTGATVKATIPTNTVTRLECVSATNWIASSITAAGVITALVAS